MIEESWLVSEKVAAKCFLPPLKDVEESANFQ
jgi:hypothetical protein